MDRSVFRYQFNPSIPISDVEETLVLALFSVKALFGAARARLEARYTIDHMTRTCVVDASTTVGRSLNRLFAGYLDQEHGEEAPAGAAA
jgi:hypothetical protein